MTPLLCTSCGRISKQMSVWGWWKPFKVVCFIQDLSPCLSAAVSGSEVPSKAAARGKCHGQLEFGPQHHSPTWTALPTRVLLESWCVRSQGCQMWGIELPQPVWPLSSAVWKGQDFQILMIKPVHNPHVKQPFPSMVARRSHLYVTGTADLMGLLYSTCPLAKEWSITTWILFVLSIPACLNCC